MSPITPSHLKGIAGLELTPPVTEKSNEQRWSGRGVSALNLFRGVRKEATLRPGEEERGEKVERRGREEPTCCSGCWPARTAPALSRCVALPANGLRAAGLRLLPRQSWCRRGLHRPGRLRRSGNSPRRIQRAALEQTSRTCAWGIRAVAAPRARRGGRCGAGAREPGRRGTRASANRRPRPVAGRKRTGRRRCARLARWAATRRLPLVRTEPFGPAAGCRSSAAPAVPGAAPAAVAAAAAAAAAAATAPPGRPRLGFGLPVVGAAALTRTTTSMTRKKGAEPSWVSAEPSAAQVAERGNGLCGGGLQIARLWPFNLYSCASEDCTLKNFKTLAWTG